MGVIGVATDATGGLVEHLHVDELIGPVVMREQPAIVGVNGLCPIARSS